MDFGEYAADLHNRGFYPERVSDEVVRTILFMYASAVFLGLTLDPAPRLDRRGNLPDQLGIRVHAIPPEEGDLIVRTSKEEWMSVVSEEPEIQGEASLHQIKGIINMLTMYARVRLRLDYTRDIRNTAPHDVPFGNRVSGMTNQEIQAQLHKVRSFHPAVRRHNLIRRTLEERIRDPNGSANKPRPRPPVEE